MVNPDRNLYEPPYDDALLYDSDLEPERPRSRPLVVLLGIVVLAAFAGVVWVAYNQGVKQGQQGVPLLTADAGPTRIVPESDGSSPTMNPAPDKAYDRLLNDQPEGEQVNILPKPEQPRTVPAPQELAAADNPTTGAAGGKYGSKATDFDAPAESAADVVPGMDQTVGAISSSTGTVSTTPREVPINTPPPATGSEDITQQLPTVQSATPRAVTPVTPATAPVQKPAALTPAKLIAVAVPAPPKPAPVEPAPAPLAAPESAPVAATPTGTMIQLGSFPNSSLAASSWSKIKSANQDLLAEYSPVIKPAEIPGKGTWYRLRVGGFADKAAAQNVCAQLTAAGQACIIAAK